MSGEPARPRRRHLTAGHGSKCGCRTSEAPPLTAEIRGFAGVSVQVGAL